jgi:hypothetical protein
VKTGGHKIKSESAVLNSHGLIVIYFIKTVKRYFAMNGFISAWQADIVACIIIDRE